MSLERTVEFLKKHEGFRSKAYLDSAGVPTIGYGNTTYPDGRKVKMGDTITKENATSMLIERARRDYNFVKNLADRNKVQLTGGQMAALTSFTYNVGPGILGGDTGIGRAFRSGDLQTVANKLPQYNKITKGGKLVPLAGLTNRRNAELSLWGGGSTYTKPIVGSDSTIQPQDDLNENYRSVGLTANQANYLKGMGEDPLAYITNSGNDAAFSKLAAGREQILREISLNPSVTPSINAQNPEEENDNLAELFLEKNEGALRQPTTPDMIFQDDVILGGGNSSDGSGLFEKTAKYFDSHPVQKLLTKIGPKAGVFMALHAPAVAAGTATTAAASPAIALSGPLAPVTGAIAFGVGYGSTQLLGQIGATAATNKLTENRNGITSGEFTEDAVSSFVPGLGMGAQKIKALSPLLRKGIALSTGTDVLGKRTVANVTTNIVAGGTGNVVEGAISSGLQGEKYTADNAAADLVTGVALTGALEGGQQALSKSISSTLSRTHSKIFKTPVSDKPLQPASTILPENIQVEKVSEVSKAAMENVSNPELANITTDKLRIELIRGSGKANRLKNAIEKLNPKKAPTEINRDIRDLLLDTTFSPDIKSHEAKIKKVEELEAKLKEEVTVTKEDGKVAKDTRIDEYRKLLIEQVAAIEAHISPLRTEFKGRAAAQDLSIHDSAVQQTDIINNNPAFQAIFEAKPEHAQSVYELAQSPGLLDEDRQRITFIGQMLESSAKLATSPRERVLDAMSAFVNTDPNAGATLTDLQDFVSSARRYTEFNEGTPIPPEVADVQAVLDLGQLMLGENSRIPVSKELAEKIKAISGNALKFKDKGSAVEVSLAGENAMTSLMPRPPEPIAEHLKTVADYLEVASIKNRNGLVSLDLIDTLRTNDDKLINEALKTAKFEIKDGLIVPSDKMDIEAQLFLSNKLEESANDLMNKLTNLAYGSFFDSSGQKIDYTTHLQHIAMDLQRSRVNTENAMNLVGSEDTKSWEALHEIILNKYSRYLAEKLYKDSQLNDVDLYNSVRATEKIIKDKLIKEGITGGKILHSKMANQKSASKKLKPLESAVFDIMERGGFNEGKHLHQVTSKDAKRIVDSFDKIASADDGTPKTLINHVKESLKFVAGIPSNRTVAKKNANALRRYLSRSGLADVGLDVSKDRGLKYFEKLSRLIGSRILTSVELNAAQFWAEGMGNTNQAYAMEYMNNFKTPDVPDSKLNKSQKEYLRSRGLDFRTILMRGEGNSADRYGVTDDYISERNATLQQKREKLDKSAIPITFDKVQDALITMSTLPFKLASAHLRAENITRALIITDRQIETGDYGHISRDELFDNNLAKLFNASRQGDRNMLAPVRLGSGFAGDPRDLAMAVDDMAEGLYKGGSYAGKVSGLALKFANDQILTRFTSYFPEVIASQTALIKNTKDKYSKMAELKANPNQYFKAALQDLSGTVGYLALFGTNSALPIGVLTSLLNLTNAVVNGSDEDKAQAFGNFSAWNAAIDFVAPGAEKLDMDKFSADPFSYLSMVYGNHLELARIFVEIPAALRGSKEAKKSMVVKGTVELLEDLGNSLSLVDVTDKTEINKKLDKTVTALSNLALGRGKMGNIKEAGVLLNENTPVFYGKQQLGLMEIYGGNTPGSKLTYINPETHEALRENMAYKSIMLGSKLLGINTEIESEKSKQFIKEEWGGDTRLFLDDL